MRALRATRNPIEPRANVEPYQPTAGRQKHAEGQTVRHSQDSVVQEKCERKQQSQHRADEDHSWQRLPTNPGAYGSQKFCVAETETLALSQAMVQPCNDGKDNKSGDRADRVISPWIKGEEKRRCQPRQHEWQCQHIRKQLYTPIDRSEEEQHPAENAAG